MYSEGLTIIIPTYNRETRLKRTLKAVVSQKEALKRIKVLIVDNHSDYDVEKTINAILTDEERKFVEVIVRPFNVGLAGALTQPFLICKTKWLWILSDDDQLVGDINVILSDIEKYSSYAYITYNVINDGSRNDECDINGIDEFIQYYTSKNHSTGELIYLSNGIYNLEILNPYLGQGIMWSSTLIGHLIPILYGLCADRNMKCRMRDYGLLFYEEPEKGTGYTQQWSTLGIANIGDIEFPGDRSLNKRIYRFVQHDYTLLHAINLVMGIQNKDRRKYVYRRLYYTFYNHGIVNRFYHILFIISNFININFVGSFIKLMDNCFLLIKQKCPKQVEWVKSHFPDSYRKFIFW